MASRKKSIPPEMMLSGRSEYVRAVILAFLVLVVLIFGRYGSGADIRSFVYMQF